jgi:hypothetical protein
VVAEEDGIPGRHLVEAVEPDHGREDVGIVMELHAETEEPLDCVPLARELPRVRFDHALDPMRHTDSEVAVARRVELVDGPEVHHLGDAEELEQCDRQPIGAGVREAVDRRVEAVAVAFETMRVAAGVGCLFEDEHAFPRV